MRTIAAKFPPAKGLAHRGGQRRYAAGGAIGFTIVELLVVIGIIGALLAMVLPAVQAARESARKLQCVNNLKQLATAVQDYATRQRHFPPAFSDPDPVDPRRPKHNLIAFLLADIDQRALADLYSFEFDWYESLRPAPERANRKLAENRIELLVCPSTVSNDELAVSDYTAAITFAPGRANARARLVESGRVARRSDWDGMLYPYASGESPRTFRYPRAEQVTDGQSHTVMLVEDAGRPEYYVAGALVSGSGKTPLSGALWADAASSLAVHNVCGEAMINCNNDNEIFSFHSAGCNFAYGDGSVHFLRQEIDPEVLVSLLTRSGGDIAAGR